MHVPNPFDISSVGRIAQTIQLTPSRIQEVAKHLGIEPAGFINGIPHFASTDVERIAAHVQADRRSVTVNRNPMF